ncbi:unnamed protein product [Ascophyllum nodosum]
MAMSRAFGRSFNRGEQQDGEISGRASRSVARRNCPGEGSACG